MCRRLLDENRDTLANSGVAHAPNSTRRKQLVVEQKQSRVQAGGLKGSRALEDYAGMQYINITNEQDWYKHLKSYGGQNMHDMGRPFLDERQLPNGISNKRIQSSPVFGGTHPFAPEYLFNAKRAMSFRAGTVDLSNSEDLDIHPHFLDVNQYWNGDEFTIPGVSYKNNGFFFLINPYVTNIFDAELPRPIYGSACVGPHLLQLFKEYHYDALERTAGTNASAADCFNCMMTQQDQSEIEMAKQMSESILSYDSIDCTDAERRELRCYGERDASNNYIIEPKQTIHKIAQETRRVKTIVIQPWWKERTELLNQKIASMKKSKKKRREAMEVDGSVRDDDDESSDSDDPNDEDEGASEESDCDYHGDAMKPIREFEDATTERHCLVMKDLICLHLSRIEDAFRSKIERETIPQGWIAMYDGLQNELAKMPNESASIAFAHGVKLQFDDVSSFAQINLWLGDFFENDCYIEGRDRRIMDELFLHLFEQYGDVTFLLLLCGYKVRIATSPTHCNA